MTPQERMDATSRLVAAWLRGRENLAKTEQLVRVSIRDGGARCTYCDLNLDHYDSIHVPDHVVPRRPQSRQWALWEAALARTCDAATCSCGKGSIEDDENIVNACRDCNKLKGQYVPVGVTLRERVADARAFVGARRMVTAGRNRPDLLARLSEDAWA